VDPRSLSSLFKGLSFLPASRPTAWWGPTVLPPIHAVPDPPHHTSAIFFEKRVNISLVDRGSPPHLRFLELHFVFFFARIARLSLVASCTSPPVTNHVHASSGPIRYLHACSFLEGFFCPPKGKDLFFPAQRHFPCSFVCNSPCPMVAIHPSNMVYALFLASVAENSFIASMQVVLPLVVLFLFSLPTVFCSRCSCWPLPSRSTFGTFRNQLLASPSSVVDVPERTRSTPRFFGLTSSTISSFFFPYRMCRAVKVFNTDPFLGFPRSQDDGQGHVSPHPFPKGGPGFYGVPPLP